MNIDELKKLDEALDLDRDTRLARDRMIAGIAGVRSADQLWDLYRTLAIPAGAPMIQLVETQRAIYWAVAAVAQITSAHPELLEKLVLDVQEYGLAHIQGRA